MSCNYPTVVVPLEVDELQDTVLSSQSRTLENLHKKLQMEIDMRRATHQPGYTINQLIGRTNYYAQKNIILANMDRKTIHRVARNFSKHSFNRGEVYPIEVRAGSVQTVPGGGAVIIKKYGEFKTSYTGTIDKNVLRAYISKSLGEWVLYVVFKPHVYFGEGEDLVDISMYTDKSLEEIVE